MPNGDRFTQLFSQLQDDYERTYGRPLTVTGGPDTPMHRKLHNGVARDVRVRDISQEQGDFIVQRAQELGLHPRDFRQTWASHKGSGPHIHIDAKSGLNSSDNAQNRPSNPQVVDYASPESGLKSTPEITALFNSLLRVEDHPAYSQAINEVMNSTGVDEQGARDYLSHPEGQKKYPLTPQQQQQAVIENSILADQLPPEPIAPTPQVTPRQANTPRQRAESRTDEANRLIAELTAPSTAQAPTTTTKAHPQKDNSSAKIQVFQTRISALDADINRMAEQRNQMTKTGTPVEMLSRFDSVLTEKAQERARLQQEIASIKTGSAPKLEDLKGRQKLFEAERNDLQKKAAASGDDELFRQAAQANDRVEALKRIINTEEQGGVNHPSFVDAASSPVKAKEQLSTAEKLYSKYGAGVGAFLSSGAQTLANLKKLSEAVNVGGKELFPVPLPDSRTLEEFAGRRREEAAISSEKGGKGFGPALTETLAQAVPTALALHLVGGAGGELAAAANAPELLGSSAALGSYGALEHAHESPAEMAKAAALNAALPLAGGLTAGMSVPTRIAGGFAAGALPDAAMQLAEHNGNLSDIDLNRMVSQGIVGGAMEGMGAFRGKEAPTSEGETANANNPNPLPEVLQRAGETRNAAKPFEEGYTYEKKPGDKEIAKAINEKLQQDEDGNSRAAKEGFTPQEREYMDRISGRNRKTQPKAPEVKERPAKPAQEAPAPTTEQAPQAEPTPYENRYKPIEVNIKAKEEPAPEKPAPVEKDYPPIRGKEQTLEQAQKFNERVLSSMDKSFPETKPEKQAVAESAPSNEAAKEATPEERTFIVNDKTVTVTDPEAIAKFDEAKARHDELKARAGRYSDQQSAGKAKKAAGLEFAKAKRNIANLLTLKEQAAGRQAPKAPPVEEPAAEIPEGSFLDAKLGVVTPHENQALLSQGDIRVVDSKGRAQVIKKPEGFELSKPVENITNIIPQKEQAPPQVEVKPDVKTISTPVKTESQPKTPLAQKAPKGEPDLVQAIRDHGGLKMNERTGEQARLRESRLKQPGVFNQKGQSYDDMAQRLYEDGYLYEPDPDEMFSLLDRAANGEKIGKRYHEEAQNAQELKDAAGFNNRPIEGETNAATERQQPESNKPEYQRNDAVRPSTETGSRGSNGPGGQKPIEAQAEVEPKEVATARTRYEDAQAKQKELERRMLKGESVDLELAEQKRIVSRAASQLVLETAKSRKGADIAGAQKDALEIFRKGETPNAETLINQYKITPAQARDIIGEAAKTRIQEKYKQAGKVEKSNPYEATSMQDLISPAQLSAIQRHGSTRGVDAERIAEERYGTRTENLNKKTAMEFYGDLKKMTPEEFKAIKERQAKERPEPQLVAEARARNQQRLAGNKLSSNPVDALIDNAITTGYDIYKGTKDFAEWSGKMIKKLGDEIKPHLEKVFAQIKTMPDHALTKSAIKEFGTTKDINEAGYLLPDGTMLDFSGKNQGAGASARGHRYLDHRDIGQVAPSIGDSPTETMQGFMSSVDAVRIDYNNGNFNVNFSKPLTESQRAQIMKNAGNGDFIIDVTNPKNGNTIYSNYLNNPSKIEVVRALRDAESALAQKTNFKDSEAGFLGFGGKPKLLDLARFQSDKGAKGFNRFKLEAAKNGYTDKAAISQAWNDAQNLPKLRTAGEFVKDFRRAVLLSSVKTFGKLGAAAAGRNITTPIEEAIGGILSKTPGLRDIAAKAPREGGFSLKAEGAALKGGFSKDTLRDMAAKVKTGVGSLDEFYGGKEPEGSPGFLNIFGRLHSAMKTEPMRAEFFRSLEKRSQHQANLLKLEGKSPRQVAEAMQSEEMQLFLGGKAYEDSQRAIFMNDHGLTDFYSRMKSEARKYGFIGNAAANVADFLTPIVKVPTNYITEATSYAFGAPKALAKVVFERGVKNLTPDQADYVMRNLKKQTVGAALMAIGYFASDQIGGYYQEGDNKDPDKPEAGGLRIFGVDVPKSLLHTPILEMLQIGATIKRVQDKEQKKGKLGALESAASGIYQGGKGLITHVPFFEEPARLAESLKDFQGAKKFAGESTRSLFIPPDVQNVASQGIPFTGGAFGDLDANGKPIKRTGEGFLDEILKGVPGLRQKVGNNRSGASGLKF